MSIQRLRSAVDKIREARKAPHVCAACGPRLPGDADDPLADAEDPATGEVVDTLVCYGDRPGPDGTIVSTPKPELPASCERCGREARVLLVREIIVPVRGTALAPVSSDLPSLLVAPARTAASASCAGHGKSKGKRPAASGPRKRPGR